MRLSRKYLNAIDKVANEVSHRDMKHVTSKEDPLIPEEHLDMSKKEKIDKIVNILYKYQDNLSDEYGYYCGPAAKETLEEIAESILSSIE